MNILRRLTTDPDLLIARMAVGYLTGIAFLLLLGALS